MTHETIASTLREQGGRYVVDAQSCPVAVLLTLKEYAHYLDLLDDEADSQDTELAARLEEAATRPAGDERQTLRDYLRQRQTPHADPVQS